MQNQAVPQDLVYLHGDVRHVLGNGLDPFNEAGPRGEPRGKGRGRDESTNRLCGLPVAFPWTVSRGHSGNQVEVKLSLPPPDSHLGHSRKAHFCRSLLCFLFRVCQTQHLGLKQTKKLLSSCQDPEWMSPGTPR